MLLQGDCLIKMKELEDNSVDLRVYGAVIQLGYEKILGKGSKDRRLLELDRL